MKQLLYIQAKYAQGLGIPPNKASHLYMVFGLSNIAGRVVSGYIVNSQWTTPKRLYTTAALLGTLVTALLPQATKHVYLLVVNVAIGLIEGAITSSIFVLQLQTIVDTVPTNLQGQIFGVCNSVYFTVCAVGPPIAGLFAFHNLCSHSRLALGTFTNFRDDYHAVYNQNCRMSFI